MKKTKIVCTMGPSTKDPKLIEQLILSGMNVARFNFSHGTLASHKKHMKMVRDASAKVGIPVALLLDTRGPEMRLGQFKKGTVELVEGQTFILTGRDVTGTEKQISINYTQLAKQLKPGDTILVSDGLVRLTVKKIDSLDIITRIENTGEIGSNKRVAVPGIKLGLPFLSEKDKEDILFGVQEKIDFIAASFVQQAEDVFSIRQLLETHHADIQIIAKIENQEGVAHMTEILEASDGFMIARGDLGVEISPEHVPLLQKQMITLCNQAGKPVITATQMLESMTANPRPTRAEASDIANAILDGTDAIMLSSETASGAYPLEAVKTMVAIAESIEPALNTQIDFNHYHANTTNTTNAICRATVQICDELNIDHILTTTESGFSARMIAKFRPKATLFAVTPHNTVMRKLLLVWGVHPVKGRDNTSRNTDIITKDAVKTCLKQQLIEKNDRIALTAGVPIGCQGSTNMIQIHIAGELTSLCH